MERTDAAILRICRMEWIFDTLLSADPSTLLADPVLAAMLEELIAYYESPQWRADYEADEQGAFPPDLKRGVLSQDGVFDFLSDIRELSQE